MNEVTVHPCWTGQSGVVPCLLLQLDILCSYLPASLPLNIFSTLYNQLDWPTISITHFRWEKLNIFRSKRSNCKWLSKITDTKLITWKALIIDILSFFEEEFYVWINVCKKVWKKCSWILLESFFLLKE